MLQFEIGQELQVFSDHVAPNLDVYEQAIFVYLFRHSYLEGSDKITIGLKSARTKMGFGAGESCRAMSESTLTKKFQSLEDKGLIKNRFGKDWNSPACKSTHGNRMFSDRRRGTRGVEHRSYRFFR